ncbi:MAG: molecular chaperone HscC [Clostridiales Family XIII bacterium]|jgi:molecular chaperone HscC|nr:molecular chaperone HscC [Clostridiales Family XIII bacterium]
MPIIGIDLGTTNSLAAYFTPEGPKIIPNSFGEHLTPSVVSVGDDGEILTGKIAAERRFTSPQKTASVFKRYMGTKKEYKLGDKTFLPEELSAFLIKKLKEDAEVFLGEEITEAVISCPAYFSEAQRRATKTAGELAGLKVDRIVSEPTAAAIAYGLHEKEESAKYLIFDLGGGTFDVSILEFTRNIMEVRAVAGDNYLGGEDFNDILIAAFLRHNDLKESDLTEREEAAVYKASEYAKLHFSKNHFIAMQAVVGGETKSTEFTADEFEVYCQPLLLRLKNPVVRALSDASVRMADISAVVLVGGATKLSIVRAFVGKLFGMLPASVINPDEAVALGAAVQAAMKERNTAIKELLLTDVCSYTLGVEVANVRSGGLIQTGLYSPIIERNTVIPTSRVERYYTMHNQQKQVEINVFQGESRNTRDNIFLGNLNIPVPLGPAGAEAVDVRFTYDVNGILEVEVTTVSTGEMAKIIIEKNPGTMTQREIEESFAQLSALKIHPRDRDEYRYLLEMGERLYQEHMGDERGMIADALAEFEEVLDKQNRGEIDAYVTRLREFFESLEGS